LASEGQEVARGDVLVVLEAMKTVFRLTAPRAGRIETISCRVGETVREGQILIQFVSAAAETD
jgi:biotin carboxyl carrier protein